MRKKTCIPIASLALAWLIAPTAATHADDLDNSTQINITRTWSQEPNGWTWPMDISVPATMPAGGYPVCILLHGANTPGGALLGGFRDILVDHVLIAPTGYQLGWNICLEASEAPDVDMVRELIETVQGFDNVNPDAIRIFGFSNGAALAHRVYIENDNAGIDTVVTAVSQLADIQFHGPGFHMPSGDPDETSAFCGYDQSVTPRTDRRYLNICNEEDDFIPYDGGLAPASGITYLEARASAFQIARAKGYGGPPKLGAGVEIGTTSVFKYEYLGGEVVHLRGLEGHNLNETQETFIGDFLATWPTPEAPCDGDLDASGAVDGGDLGLLVAAWGTSAGDLNGDGSTDGGDLGLLISFWGTCP